MLLEALSSVIAPALACIFATSSAGFPPDRFCWTGSGKPLAKFRVRFLAIVTIVGLSQILGGKSFQAI